MYKMANPAKPFELGGIGVFVQKSRPMRDVTTSYLRQHIAEVMAQVNAGESFRVVRHGHPVAYLYSPRDHEALNGVTVAMVADECGVLASAVVALMDELSRDPDWGRFRVIAEAHPKIGETVLTRAAGVEIARRLMEQQPPKRGTA